MINDASGVPIYADKNDAKEKLSPRIKEECERRILEVMPDWRQRNTIAELSSDNAETKAAAITAWAQVTTLRTKSDQIEASILSMSDAEIIEFDATDDANWA